MFHLNGSQLFTTPFCFAAAAAAAALASAADVSHCLIFKMKFQKLFKGGLSSFFHPHLTFSFRRGYTYLLTYVHSYIYEGSKEN